MDGKQLRKFDWGVISVIAAIGLFYGTLTEGVDSKTTAIIHLGAWHLPAWTFLSPDSGRDNARPR